VTWTARSRPSWLHQRLGFEFIARLYVFPGTTLTVCCLILENGYAVTGQSAAASPENFDEAVGRRIARADARDKIWQLEGYLLRESLHLHRMYGSADPVHRLGS
jgi:hypothetical protein